MLNSLQQNPPKKDFERQNFKADLALQDCEFTCVLALHRQVIFPPSPSINCSYILRHVPICILNLLTLELFQVGMKAPNCVYSCLELIHFTARMKKLLTCQQSTKCPSHTSSQGLNKSDWESQRKEFLARSSLSCTQSWGHTSPQTHLSFAEKEHSLRWGYSRSC